MNYASHYREAIYKMINDELKVDFYFGDSKNLSIKKLDFNSLSNFKKELVTYEYRNFIWYVGSLHILCKNYDTIVLTGDLRVLNNWIILVLARLTGKRVYIWTHGWYGREGKAKKFLKKLFFNLSNKIFLYGNYAKELLIAEGLNAAQLIPVFNSLNYDKQLMVRSRLKNTSIFKDHFQNDYSIIIFIGRVQKSKSLEQILDAMLLLRDQCLFFNFVLIGLEESSYDFRNEVFLRSLHDNVWLFGPCYDEDVIGELIYNADICVSPGSIGLTAIHSLMYGTPVLTHNDLTMQGPEFEAIKEGYNGAFFKKNNVKDLSEKIKIVVEAQFSKEQCFEVVDIIWNPHNQVELFKKELMCYEENMILT